MTRRSRARLRAARRSRVPGSPKKRRKSKRSRPKRSRAASRCSNAASSCSLPCCSRGGECRARLMRAPVPPVRLRSPWSPCGSGRSAAPDRAARPAGTDKSGRQHRGVEKTPVVQTCIRIIDDQTPSYSTVALLNPTQDVQIDTVALLCFYGRWCLSPPCYTSTVCVK